MDAQLPQSERAKKAIWLILALVALGIAVTSALHVRGAFGQRSYNPRGDNGGLQVGSKYLCFGEVWEDAAFVWPLSIENPLSHDVLVADFTTSCSCSVVEPRSLTIPAGEAREVRIVLNLTNKKADSSALEWRNMDISVRPQFQGDGRNLRRFGWTISGRVRSAFRLAPTVVDLGRISELEQTIPAQTINVESFIPLKRLSAISSCDAVQANVVPHGDEGRRFDLIVRPATHRPTQLDAKLSLRAELADGTQLPAKLIDCKGRVVADVQASPPESALGARQVGETVAESLTLYSLTNRRFKVLGVTIEGDGVKLKWLAPVLCTRRCESRISRYGWSLGPA